MLRLVQPVWVGGAIMIWRAVVVDIDRQTSHPGRSDVSVVAARGCVLQGGVGAISSRQSPLPCDAQRTCYRLMAGGTLSGAATHTR